MTHSINTPWAISDKYRNRYGNTWADLDFVFFNKISEEVFKTDPMATMIGELCIYNQRIKLSYKDLINYSKAAQIACSEAYINGTKTETTDFRVKSQTLTLQRHELRKLSETLTEAASSALRAYELGLYL
jgi:hypothetical protein